MNDIQLFATELFHSIIAANTLEDIKNIKDICNALEPDDLAEKLVIKKELRAIIMQYGFTKIKLLGVLMKYNPYINNTHEGILSSISLINAVQDSDIPLIEFLLEHKANVNLPQGGDSRHCGYTPLYVAAMKGNVQVAKLLLDHGAYINIAMDNKAHDDPFGVFGDTPLHVAGEKNHKEMFNFLISRSANPDAHNEYGQKPCLKLTANESPVPLASVSSVLFNQQNQPETDKASIWMANSFGYIND
jgi:hypothetical protein